MSLYRIIVFFVFLFLIGVHPIQISAQLTKPLDSGDNNGRYVTRDDPSTPQDESGVLTIQGIEGIIFNILAVAVSGIGFAGFVMMIIGSFQYLLSGGDSKGVDGGKNTITFAIVGLVVALSSWIILNFIATFTGVETIKVFNICFDGQC